VRIRLTAEITMIACGADPALTWHGPELAGGVSDSGECPAK
jgi:hypothetical protein